MVSLPAHFDGERIVLDEPFGLPAQAPLMVTLLTPSVQSDPDSEEAWLRAVASSDAVAFLADSAEDIYTLEDSAPLDHAV